MTSMAWYPLPQSGSTLSAGDEFFENQSAGWSLWSFRSSDDQNTAGVYSDEHEKDAAQCSTRRSEEQSEAPAPLEPQFAHGTEDIFMSQLSDEEMRRIDAPFEALDMFPDSMHRLLSYENMLSGVLTGSENQDAGLEQNGVDTMDTCGFPLFSHGLQNESRSAEPNSSEIPADPPSKDKAGVSMLKRSRSFTDAESVQGFEALVLEELEDVVFQVCSPNHQSEATALARPGSENLPLSMSVTSKYVVLKLTKKTRICYRDAFYRLAESSKAKCSTANGAAGVGSSRPSFQQPEGNASRITTPGCPERETNAIDRTVADLTLKPSCSAPPHQSHGSCYAGDSEAEAQSTASWVTRA